MTELDPPEGRRRIRGASTDPACCAACTRERQAPPQHSTAWTRQHTRRKGDVLAALRRCGWCWVVLLMATLCPAARGGALPRMLLDGLRRALSQRLLGHKEHNAGVIEATPSCPSSSFSSSSSCSSSRGGPEGDGTQPLLPAPHILHVLVSDWGYDCVGFHNPGFDTPFIDSLAAQGIRLHHFVTDPVGSWSRESLMFGQQSHGPTPTPKSSNNNSNSSHPHPRGKGKGVKEESLYWRLRGKGYRTLLVGKWAMEQGLHPLRAGFDRAVAAHVGTQGDGADHYSYVRTDFLGRPYATVGEGHHSVLDYAGITVDPSRFKANGSEGEEEREGRYSTRLFADLMGTLVTQEARGAEGEGRKEEEEEGEGEGEEGGRGPRLYMQLAQQVCSSPMQVPPHYLQPGTKCGSYRLSDGAPAVLFRARHDLHTLLLTTPSRLSLPPSHDSHTHSHRGEEKGGEGSGSGGGREEGHKREQQEELWTQFVQAPQAMCGMMRALDDSLKSLQHRLEALGMWQHTLVVMHGDSGGSWTHGASNTPLRGAKLSLFEGGVRTPALLGGPYLQRLLQLQPQLEHEPLDDKDDATTSEGQKRTDGMDYPGLFHVSDLYPTLLSLASPQPLPPPSSPSSEGEFKESVTAPTACATEEKAKGVDHWPAMLRAWRGGGEGLGIERLPRQCLHAVYQVQGNREEEEEEAQGGEGEKEGEGKEGEGDREGEGLKKRERCKEGYTKRQTLASIREVRPLPSPPPTPNGSSTGKGSSSDDDESRVGYGVWKLLVDPSLLVRQALPLPPYDHASPGDSPSPSPSPGDSDGPSHGPSDSHGDSGASVSPRRGLWTALTTALLMAPSQCKWKWNGNRTWTHHDTTPDNITTSTDTPDNSTSTSNGNGSLPTRAALLTNGERAKGEGEEEGPSQVMLFELTEDASEARDLFGSSLDQGKGEVGEALLEVLRGYVGQGGMEGEGVHWQEGIEWWGEGEGGDGADYERCRREGEEGQGGEGGACARLYDKMRGLHTEERGREKGPNSEGDGEGKGAAEGKGEGWWVSEGRREVLWRWVWGVGGALALVCALPLTALGLVVLLIMRTVVLLPPDAETSSPRTPSTASTAGSSSRGSITPCSDRRGSLTPGSRGSRPSLGKI